MIYKKYLTENVLPFWLNNSFDKENYGIFYSIDKNSNVTSKNKNTWFTGRALWSFATAYNTIEQNAEYLNACKSLYTYLTKSVMPNGRLPFITDAEGNVLETKNLFHGEAHAAFACAAYYKACKNEDVKNDALKFFDIAYNLYMTGDARKETTADNKERYIFGRDMFALSIAQAMRISGIKDERIEILANESIKNIINTGYINDDLKTVTEYAGCSGEAYDYSCFGHIYEAAWFILYEGEVKNDVKIKMLGKKILDYCTNMEPCKDFEAVRMGNTSDYNEFVWWPQCEAIIAYYTAYSIFKEEFYLETAKRIENFAFKNFADTKNGEWFLKCDKNGNVVDDTKGSSIKGVFHLPRMLMALSALQEKEGILNFM